MADPNAGRKKQIEARARKANPKVQKYIKLFLHKIDQAGPMAGIWLESLERDFDSLKKKPDGLLKSFTDKDFDALKKVVFG